MDSQTDHQRERIIEADYTRLQEAHWGESDDEPESDQYEIDRQDEIDNAAERLRA